MRDRDGKLGEARGARGSRQTLVGEQQAFLRANLVVDVDDNAIPADDFAILAAQRYAARVQQSPTIAGSPAGAYLLAVAAVAAATTIGIAATPYVSHADQAEEVFSTLMGDIVEPRREFIQDNALKVSNRDV